MKSFWKQLRYLFVPHEQNQYKARALHPDFLTYYLIAALILTFGFRVFTHSSNVLGIATDITIDKLYELTNTQRAQFGAPSLTYNEELASAARAKAADMFAKNYWAHYGPDGETPWDFIKQSGYSYQYAGENLAKNFLFSQNVVDAWMNSPSHRENMLDSHYTNVGFAVVNGVLNGEETTLVVQMFGQPTSSGIVRTTQAQNTAPVAAIPTVEPAQPTPLATIPPAEILSQSKNTSNGLHLFPIYFNLNIIFLVFLLIALISDFVIAGKMGFSRSGGKNMLHAMFIAFILVGLYIMTNGSVL